MDEDEKSEERDEEGEYNNENGEEEENEEEKEEEGEIDNEPLPPPPPEEEKELLLLIEFLVDTLTVWPENVNLEGIDPCALTGPLQLAITFLHFPTMFISEKDSDPEKQTGENKVQYLAGKSLTFALTESQFEDPPPIHLVVEVCRLMPHAFYVPSINIGKTKIDLTELFRKVFEKYDENPGKVVSKSVKDKYELNGEDGKVTGDVTIYVRLTCLGENIVTEFSKPECEENPLLFKNRESEKVYKCRETDIPERSVAVTLGGKGDGRQKPDREEVKPPLRVYDPDDENFEEIYAEINGSAMIIKVEKSGRKPPQKKYDVSEFCDCNIPLPKDLVAGLSDLSVSPASESSIIACNGTPEDGEAQTDKKVGLDPANQLLFGVPPAGQLSAKGFEKGVAYTVKTCKQAEEHGHKGMSKFKVTTGKNVEGDIPQLPNDPEKDVFLLRIIKRGKKNKTTDVLELEFKTPKEKLVPPPKPPYLVERGAGPEKNKDKDKKKKK